LVAVGEEGIVSFDEKVANAGQECVEIHKYVRGKVA
jgi:hypothetical protein